MLDLYSLLFNKSYSVQFCLSLSLSGSVSRSQQVALLVTMDGRGNRDCKSPGGPGIKSGTSSDLIIVLKPTILALAPQQSENDVISSLDLLINVEITSSITAAPTPYQRCEPAWWSNSGRKGRASIPEEGVG
jgi:hypothetical protein